MTNDPAVDVEVRFDLYTIDDLPDPERESLIFSSQHEPRSLLSGTKASKRA